MERAFISPIREPGCSPMKLRVTCRSVRKLHFSGRAGPHRIDERTHVRRTDVLRTAIPTKSRTLDDTSHLPYPRESKAAANPSRNGGRAAIAQAEPVARVSVSLQGIAAMPYRSNQHVFDAVHIEGRELRECARNARSRRMRPAAALGVLFALIVAGLFVRARLPRSPVYHCHRVQLRSPKREEGLAPSPQPPRGSRASGDDIGGQRRRPAAPRC